MAVAEPRLGRVLPSPPLCRQATHEDFANKLYGAPSVSDSKRFSKPKLSRTDFTIDHYAGERRVQWVFGWYCAVVPRDSCRVVEQLFQQLL